MRTEICTVVSIPTGPALLGQKKAHTVCPGHALNKITKDLINRSKLIQGYRVQSVRLSAAHSTYHTEPEIPTAIHRDSTRMASLSN